MADCDAHIRPFPDDTELTCQVPGQHSQHAATLLDFAYPGSKTVLHWDESDRRTYHGEWPGKCLEPARAFLCPLPKGHRGDHVG